MRSIRPTVAALAALLVLALALALATPAAAQDADGPKGPFGTISCPSKSFTYPLTEEDALWTARMLVGESGGEGGADDAAVLWCMLNSYAIRPVRSYETFTDFIRAYCTPLQPYLKSQGAIDRHRKAKTPMVEVEPGKWQLKRHVDIQARPWSKLPARARDLVLAVFRGEKESVCGNATQFCSTAVYFKDEHDRRPTDEEHREFTLRYAEKKKWTWVEVEGASPRNNVFFEEQRFKDLPRPAVRVARPAKR